ncbi:MAG: 2-dehydro-3-deoxygalactonokinase [Pseudomonadota bacterium]
MAPRPALIGIDWGTTSFRAYQIAADGMIIDTVEAAEGIANPPAGGFEETFERHVGPWLDDGAPLPVVASGMISSRNGWRETPYLKAPADAAAFGASLTEHVSEAGRRLHFVSGLICDDASGNPDVMRGEETQLIGCMALGVPDGLFVMPGTHSKWAMTQNGRLLGFRTYMTGEVFAVMRAHSLLGAFIGCEAWSEAAFANGVAASLADKDSVLHRLFTVRSRVLDQRMAADDTAAYLSGILIGEELRAGLADLAGDAELTVVGAGALVDRYLAALAVAGVAARPASDAAVARGHYEIAKRAGLLA